MSRLHFLVYAVVSLSLTVLPMVILSVVLPSPFKVLSILVILGIDWATGTAYRVADYITDTV